MCIIYVCWEEIKRDRPGGFRSMDVAACLVSCTYFSTSEMWVLHFTLPNSGGNCTPWAPIWGFIMTGYISPQKDHNRWLSHYFILPQLNFHLWSGDLIRLIQIYTVACAFFEKLVIEFYVELESYLAMNLALLGDTGQFWFTFTWGEMKCLREYSYNTLIFCPNSGLC